MLDCGYRLDLVVENQVILEIKSVSSLAPIHEAQMLSYLKMSDCHRGLLFNFNVLIIIHFFNPVLLSRNGSKGWILFHNSSVNIVRTIFFPTVRRTIYREKTFEYTP